LTSGTVTSSQKFQI